MKVKLDENLPFRLVELLERLGHDVDTVPSEKLTGKLDQDVWAAVRVAGRLLVTQDLDFSDVRQFAPGSHPGILVVRLRAPGANALIERIVSAVTEHPLDSLAGCFAVLSDRKLRVRRP
jgi:predicted nuclease of predicted toxin-antitoxin system